MRRAPIALLFALLAALLIICLPASAAPQIGAKQNGLSLTEERGLHVYVDCWDAFKSRCGRNIVDDGLASGNPPTEAKVKDWTATMERWLNPPTPPAVDSPVVVAAAPATTSVAPSSAAPSTVQCESGGDYSINTGNGYYGGYQFDSGTWDAYGDPAYGEANEAPPAVQDAAAASVPYDAWPNC